MLKGKVPILYHVEISFHICDLAEVEWTQHQTLRFLVGSVVGGPGGLTIVCTGPLRLRLLGMCAM